MRSAESTEQKFTAVRGTAGPGNVVSASAHGNVSEEIPAASDGLRLHRPPRRRRPGGTRRRSERGEGVVSTAIVVLIIAFLGIGLWTGFDGMMNSATDKTRAQVEQIGE